MCLDTTKFILLSFLSPIKTIYPTVSTKPQPNAAKSPLPADVRRSKTLLLKLPNNAGVERTFFFQNSRTQQRIKSFSSATGAKPWNCIPLNTRSLPKHKFEAAIRHLAWEFEVSPTNDVWETIAGIPYRWRVTTQIWVVLLIGWNKFPTRHD